MSAVATLAATSAGVVAIIAATSAAIGAIMAQVTIMLRSWASSRRADRHQESVDRRADERV